MQYGLATVLLFIFMAAAATEAPEGSSPTVANVESNSSDNKAGQQVKNSPLISKQEYESIKEGMTIEQISQIVGSKGTEVLKDGATVLVEFKAEKDLGGEDAQVSLLFQDGKLTEKRYRNHGTPSGAANKPFVEKAELEQLQEGLTYQQTVDLVGIEGKKISEKGNSITYVFPADASIGGGEVRILFDNNKLSVVTHFTADDL
ncbi:hypothetical protein L1N85_16110 [Paenibacillus alkaliterrae]|uniref:hypothetical protein n=1 Tax=Paenibacillus alkaliterrae TaxID=320909 RepID=UPI001F1A1F5C|nr:hypothetical protein [Paenibacillus alkaliterrae]MCF2939942.1 hypothetical protein [Paenibacillus alkaliterrae]